MRRHQMAQMALYGGLMIAAGSSISELKKAASWAEVFTPSHVFEVLGAVVTAAGALYHQAPGSMEVTDANEKESV